MAKKITGNNSQENHNTQNVATTKIAKFRYANIDSVPQLVDKFILKQAHRLHCNGIGVGRLVGANDIEKYIINYFNSNIKEKSVNSLGFFWVKFDPKTKRIISNEKIIAPQNRLDKTSSNNYHCWRLAIVYKDAHYSGTSFQFSQGNSENAPNKIYHDVIWDLNQYQSQCWENFYGHFNDCISSHHFSPDNRGNLQTVPYQLVIFKDSYRNGPSYTFKNGKQYYDDNWIDEKWREGIFWKTINDKVSSMDIQYKVSNPY